MSEIAWGQDVAAALDSAKAQDQLVLLDFSAAPM